MRKYTIVIPTRNNVEYANDACNSVLASSSHKIILIDDNSDEKLNYIEDKRIKIIRNKFKQGLASSWNQGILRSTTNNIIIMSHKARPEARSFEKMDKLLDENFALVAIRSFHFFGFNKFLFSITGLFDSEFKQGWYEDADMVCRMVEHNLGCYTENDLHTVPGVDAESSWREYIENRDYFTSKWRIEGKKLIKYFHEKNLASKKKFAKLKPIKYKTYNETVNHMPGGIELASLREFEFMGIK